MITCVVGAEQRRIIQQYHEEERARRRSTDEEGIKIKEKINNELKKKKINNKIKKKMKRRTGSFSIQGLYDDKPDIGGIPKDEADEHKTQFIKIEEEDNLRHVMIGNFIKENIKLHHDQYVKLICNIMRKYISKPNRNKMRKQTKDNHMNIALCCDALPDKYKYKCDKYNKYSVFYNIYINIFYYLKPAISKRKKHKSNQSHGKTSRYDSMKNVLMSYINFYDFDSFCIICPLLFNTMRHFQFEIAQINSEDCNLIHELYNQRGTPRVITDFADLILFLTQYTHIIISLQNGKCIYIDRNKEYMIYPTEEDFFNDKGNQYNDASNFWMCDINDGTGSNIQMIFSFEAIKLTKYKCRKYYIDKNIFGSKDYYMNTVKVYIYDKQASQRIKQIMLSKIYKIWNKWLT